MNTFLKSLAAVALVMITIAAGLHILHSVSGSPKRDEGRSTTPTLTEPRAVSSGLRPAATTQPIAIKPDNPLQPSYPPINQPAYMQFLRQEGKVYHNRVVGKIAGQASKKDWGFRGTAYFEYIYAVESRGTIIKNDGLTIVEERTFGMVHEDVMTSEYMIRVELPAEKLAAVFDTLALLGGSPAIGISGNAALTVVNIVQLPVSKDLVEAARKSGFFSRLPDIDPQQFEREIKMFTQGADNRLLEGKTVRIVFKDGFGVSKIEPVRCELKDQERDVIIRTNFVMDHYLFPDRKVEPGADWSVNGSAFAGFLDPRLRGKVGGRVTVMRTPDFIDASGKVSKKLRLTGGEIIISDESGPTNITGQITALRGVCILPDDYGVITAAQLDGYAEYRKVSRDHLLFEAQTTLQPKFEVRYECTVETK